MLTAKILQREPRDMKSSPAPGDLAATLLGL